MDSDPTCDLAGGHPPPTSDPVARALARLSEAFTAVSALADAVDALPVDLAAKVRPSTSAAFGRLTEAEDVLTDLVAGGGW